MLINELLPNPKGKDASGEFIELFNNGANRALLYGYVLKDGSGKKYALRGELDAGSYLVLPYSLTKLNLNNNGDSLFLYNPSGQLVDKAEFLLQAKEGASLARLDTGTSAGNNNGVFAFTNTPTPGKPNIFQEVYAKKEDFSFQYTGAVLSNSLSGVGTLALIFTVAISLAVLLVYLLKDVIYPKEYIL